MLTCLKALNDYHFDSGTDFFEPTRLEVTSIDVGNPAANIIPHKIEAQFGIRLNTLQNDKELCEKVRKICTTYAGKHDLILTFHGHAFLTEDQQKIELVQKTVRDMIGQLPSLSTTGATTDGRFISAYCPVIECGMREATMHQIDEHVALIDIQRLTDIYFGILKSFFLSDDDSSGREKQ